MCTHCIIGEGITPPTQVKIAFADLEKHLGIPALCINTDALLLTLGNIHWDPTQVIFLFITVPHIHHFCWNDFPILYDFDYNRKQILRPSPFFLVFLVNGCQGMSLLKDNLLYGKKIFRVRSSFVGNLSHEPSVTEDRKNNKKNN